MNKKDFIQRIMIRTCPAPEKIDAGIQYAEGLWARLTQAGYGDAKQQKVRTTRNWYQELTTYQREWFDQFWDAFAYKHGRNDAAKAWIKLGELPKDKYQQIVDAASAEAKRPREPGTTRKMAEGWLTEHRYDDHITVSTSKKNQAKTDKKAGLKADLNHLEMMLKHNPENEQLQQQIEDLKRDLES